MAGRAALGDPRRRAWARRRDNPDTRAEILYEAAIAFARDGYDGASLAAIARQVGVTAPSVYNHFRSKNEILFTVLDEYADRVLKLCRDAVASGSSPPDRLRRFVHAFIMLDLKNRAIVPIVNIYFQLSTGVERVLTKTQIRKLNDKHRALVFLLRRIIEDGVNAGTFRTARPTVAAFSVLGSISNAVYWFRESGSLEPADIAAELATLALASLGSLTSS